LRDMYNITARRVAYYIGDLHLLSTAITKLGIFTTVLRKCPPEMIGHSAEFERCVHGLVIMLSVFTPHFGAEAWAALASAPSLSKSNIWRKDEPVWRQDWPALDEDAPFDLEIYFAGEQRGKIAIDRRILSKLNAAEAFEIAKDSKVVLEAAKTFENIVPKSITHVENFGAKLFVNARQKKKEKKKVQKNVI